MIKFIKDVVYTTAVFLGAMLIYDNKENIREWVKRRKIQKPGEG